MEETHPTSSGASASQRHHDGSEHATPNAAREVGHNSALRSAMADMIWNRQRSPPGVRAIQVKSARLETPLAARQPKRYSRADLFHPPPRTRSCRFARCSSP